jgi:hypothetical protein
MHRLPLQLDDTDCQIEMCIEKKLLLADSCLQSTH